METLSTLFDEIWERRGVFFAVFFGIFIVSYGILFAIDFVPEEKGTKGGTATSTGAVKVKETGQASTFVAPANEVAQYPSRVIIPDIGIDSAVLNPESRTIAALDEALLEGAVRHPDSADFKNTGTIFLFGHSSYLPVVRNKNFQAFNGIQKLEEGSVIRLESDNMAYTYRVESVEKVAASDTTVALDNSEERLILVTCNSFGSKDDRFVVKAKLVEKAAL